jgi:hypothetical protein
VDKADLIEHLMAGKAAVGLGRCDGVVRVVGAGKQYFSSLLDQQSPIARELQLL